MGNFEMTLNSKIYLLMIILTHLCISVNGQNVDTLIFNQKLVLARIDSICNIIDSNKNLVEGITEGGFFNQKGGWETYDLKSKGGDTLFRIRHNSLTDLYYKTIYYYHNNEVLKCTFEIEDWNSGNGMKPIYSVTYYFNNDTLVSVINEDGKYSNHADILAKGRKYQNDFYSNLILW